MEKIFYFKNDVKPTIEYTRDALRYIMYTDIKIADGKSIVRKSMFRTPKFRKAFNRFFANERLEYIGDTSEGYQPIFSRGEKEFSIEKLNEFELCLLFKGAYILYSLNTFNETPIYARLSIVIIDELMPTDKDKLTKYYNDILDFAIFEKRPDATFFIGENLVNNVW